MLATALAITLFASPAPAESTAASDSVAAPPSVEVRKPGPPRVVRIFEEVLVRAPLHDPFSSETVHLVSARQLAGLPIDDLIGGLALEAGVVSRGEELHVRGGRAGEVQVVLDGVSVNEPLRNRAMNVPLVALQDVELVSGAMDADHVGALAGVVRLRTVDPGETPSGLLRWETDARTQTHYDRVSGRLGGPLRLFGLGAVVSGEALLDDTALPSLRSETRHRLLGASLGWRADNQLFGLVKIAPLGPTPPLALEVVGSRSLDQPYDPMWSLDGYTTPCGDPDCISGPRFSKDPRPGYTRYRAADHLVMTDDRRWLALLRGSLGGPAMLGRVTLAWDHDRRLTSLGARETMDYLDKDDGPVFGDGAPFPSEPFFIYGGNDPFYQRSTSESFTLRADLERATPRGDRAKIGLGTSYDHVALTELDASLYGTNLDSLRVYDATAPSAFAYVQTRWVFEGLVANAGLRGEYFTAGSDAATQSHPAPGRGLWSLSPRFGLAYPISNRDVFSLAYVRIQQNPARDFLYDNRLKPPDGRPVGNPALEPATVISYQAAVKHLFTVHWALQSALFYRDLFGLVGARFVQNTAYGLPRPLYENEDEGHAAGFELSVIHDGGASRSELHYTWLQAYGTQSYEEGYPYGLRVGERPVPLAEHPLDWDRRHTLAFSHRRTLGGWTLGWATTIGSGLPWTPAVRREVASDLTLINSRRLPAEENTNVTVRWRPRWPVARRLQVGFDVRNLFDRRSSIASTVNGYPQPLINSYYDDYGAFRSETGLRGGAFWDDLDGDGQPGWIRVHDPRLVSAPRLMRMSLSTDW